MSNRTKAKQYAPVIGTHNPMVYFARYAYERASGWKLPARRAERRKQKEQAENAD
jgi:hypothetical protein